MKTAGEIKETLYKHYKEAYDKVEPGQAYPQWDINAQWLYNGIEELTADLTAKLEKERKDKEAYKNAVEAEINNKIEHIDKILENVQSELLKIQLVAARTELFILLEKLTNLTPTTNE